MTGETYTFTAISKYEEPIVANSECENLGAATLVADDMIQSLVFITNVDISKGGERLATVWDAEWLEKMIIENEWDVIENKIVSDSGYMCSFKRTYMKDDTEVYVYYYILTEDAEAILAGREPSEPVEDILRVETNREDWYIRE